jgi:hypothetical protein
MVAAARRGASLRTVARRFRVDVATVQLWVQRARHQRLDRGDWADRPPLPRTIGRTETAVEDLVLIVRRALKDTSALGEFGAAAMRRELLQRGLPVVPSRRTIGRILARRGALDARQRVRRRPHRSAGICQRGPLPGLRSRASTSSRASSSPVAHRSKSAMSSLCMGAWSARGPGPA